MSLSHSVPSAVLLSQPLTTIESMERAGFSLPVHLCCSLCMAWFKRPPPNIFGLFHLTSTAPKVGQLRPLGNMSRRGWAVSMHGGHHPVHSACGGGLVPTNGASQGHHTLVMNEAQAKVDKKFDCMAHPQSDFPTSASAVDFSTTALAGVGIPTTAQSRPESVTK